MKKKRLVKGSIEVHSKLRKWWLVYVRGYYVECRHRTPELGTFGGMHYKDWWTLHRKG